MRKILYNSGQELLEELKDLIKRMNDYDDPSPDTTYERMMSAICDAATELERMYQTDTEQMKEEVRTKLLECVDRLDK